MPYLAARSYILGVCTVELDGRLKANGIADTHTEADRWLSSHGYQRTSPWQLSADDLTAAAHVRPTTTH